MPTTTELVEFTALSSRAETVIFDVLDADLTKIGEVTPDGPPSRTVDTTRATKRSLQSLRLIPSDTSAIDMRSELIRPSWKFANGALFPLGVFGFANPTMKPHSWGTESENTLDDLSSGFSESDRAVSYSRGQVVTTALYAFLAAIFSTPITVTPSTRRFGQPAVWPPGTSEYQIAADLCALIGYLPPYFDNAGTLICRPIPALRGSTPPFTYAPGVQGTIEVDSINESSSLLTAPNRYVVIGGGSSQATPVVGVFDIPDGAPNSALNRGGKIVQKTIALQSVESNAAARTAARAAYFDDAIVETVEFDAVADPRHDIYDLVRYGTRNYLEVASTLVLGVGGANRHTLRNLYD